MIYVIGIASGGRSTLTPGAVERIDGAALLVGGRRHLEWFPDFDGEKAAMAGGLEKAASRIDAVMSKGRDVAVLATGDPLLFGIGAYIIKRFGADNVEVVPNVSTVAEAFSRIKVPWEDARVVSVHGRGGGDELDRVADEVLSSAKAAVFTDSRSTPAVVARALIERGARGYGAWVCESLGTEGEKVSPFTLEALARRKRFDPLNILLLVREAPAAPGAPDPSFGRPDPLFAHSSGMITKEEVRAVALAKLRLTERAVVWDVGSGCGSVAVEAALLAPLGRVYAVEKDPARVGLIRENIERFAAANVDVVEGTAPACLKAARLPAPDAVFVGGGGPDVADILRYVSKRIKPGRPVVVASVTVETTSAAFSFFKKKGWEAEAVLVSLAKTREIGPDGGLSLLESRNPVFLITGRRP